MAPSQRCVCVCAPARGPSLRRLCLAAGLVRAASLRTGCGVWLHAVSSRCCPCCRWWGCSCAHHQVQVTKVPIEWPTRAFVAGSSLAQQFHTAYTFALSSAKKRSNMQPDAPEQGTVGPLSHSCLHDSSRHDLAGGGAKHAGPRPLLQDVGRQERRGLLDSQQVWAALPNCQGVQGLSEATPGLLFRTIGRHYMHTCKHACKGGVKRVAPGTRHACAAAQHRRRTLPPI